MRTVDNALESGIGHDQARTMVTEVAPSVYSDCLGLTPGIEGIVESHVVTTV